MDPVQGGHANRAAKCRLVPGDHGEHVLFVPGRQVRQRNAAQGRGPRTGPQVPTNVRRVAGGLPQGICPGGAGSRHLRGELLWRPSFRIRGLLELPATWPVS
jgi:hypothetical protein